MRITDYELYTVPPRWQFLKLETADGSVGWGEVYAKWHTVAGSEPATTAAVDQLFVKYLEGADPLDVERLWEAMYRCSFYRGGPVHMSAIAGIDQALWDLKGRHYGAPVYDLLGGKARDRVRLYRHVTPDTAAEAVAEGFAVLKQTVDPAFERLETPDAVARAVEPVTAIRDAVGPEVGVAVDFHGRVRGATAKRLAAALEPHDPAFLEEPLPPEHADAFADLAAQTTVPIAAGERMFTRWDAEPVLASGAIDVIQPDVAHSGGLTEAKKIADLADIHDVALAPHCPVGPVCLAASLHLDLAAPNFVVQEQTLLGKEGALAYLENPELFDVADGGFVEAPDGPGLGVAVDEEVVRERALADGETLDDEWARPNLRHEDGGVAEW